MKRFSSSMIVFASTALALKMRVHQDTTAMTDANATGAQDLEAEVASAVKQIKKERKKAEKKIVEAAEAATEAATEAIRVQAEAVTEMIKSEAEVASPESVVGTMTEAELEALMEAEQTAADAAKLEAEASSEIPVEPVDAENSSLEEVKTWEIRIPTGDLMNCVETEGKLNEWGHTEEPNLHCVLELHDEMFAIEGYAWDLSEDPTDPYAPEFNGKALYGGQCFAHGEDVYSTGCHPAWEWCNDEGECYAYEEYCYGEPGYVEGPCEFGAMMTCTYYSKEDEFDYSYCRFTILEDDSYRAFTCHDQECIEIFEDVYGIHVESEGEKNWEIRIPTGDLMHCVETEGKLTENGHMEEPNLHCVLELHDQIFAIEGMAYDSSRDPTEPYDHFNFNGKQLSGQQCFVYGEERYYDGCTPAGEWCNDEGECYQYEETCYGVPGYHSPCELGAMMMCSYYGEEDEFDSSKCIFGIVEGDSHLIFECLDQECTEIAQYGQANVESEGEKEVEDTEETHIEPIDTEHSSPEEVKTWEIRIPTGDLMNCVETEAGKLNEWGGMDEPNLHCVLEFNGEMFTIEGMAMDTSEDSTDPYAPKFNGKQLRGGQCFAYGEDVYSDGCSPAGEWCNDEGECYAYEEFCWGEPGYVEGPCEFGAMMDCSYYGEEDEFDSSYCRFAILEGDEYTAFTCHDQECIEFDMMYGDEEEAEYSEENSSTEAADLEVAKAKEAADLEATKATDAAVLEAAKATEAAVLVATTTTEAADLQ